MSPRRVFRGFTLIELLVVVAIIALLISILLPSLSQARRTAQMVKCQAVMKQLTVANNYYADAWENTYVPLKLLSGSAKGGGFLSYPTNYQFRQFLGIPGGTSSTSDAAFSAWPFDYYCPTMPDKYKTKVGRVYPMNWEGIQRVPNNFNAAHIVQRTKVVNPSEKNQQFEGESWIGRSNGANYRLFWDIWGDVDRTDGAPADWTIYRHIEGTNILYFDGHVAHRTKQECWDGTTNRNRLWQIFRAQ